MVNRSNDISVRSGQPSWLAVAEMGVMSTLLIWRILSLGTSILPWLGVAAAILGPLTLLRTEYSTKLGLAYYSRLVIFNRRVDSWRDDITVTGLAREMRLFIVFAIHLFYIPAWMVAIRIWSIARTVCKRPAESLLAIPKNWSRTVFVLDSCTPPEPVPGVGDFTGTELYSVRVHFRSVFWHLRNRFADRSFGFKAIYLIGWLTQCGLLYIPGLALRLGLKSSSFLWYPLIYCVRSVTGKPVGELLDQVRTDPFERIKRVAAIGHFAWILICTYIVWTAFEHLSPSSSEFIAKLFGLPIYITADGVLVIKRYGTLYSLLSFIVLIFTLWLWRLGEQGARGRRLEMATSPTYNVVVVLLISRGIFGIALILCSLYNVYNAIRTLPIPTHIQFS
jgi:uncharacterized membrane protein